MPLPGWCCKSYIWTNYCVQMVCVLMHHTQWCLHLDKDQLFRKVLTSVCRMKSGPVIFHSWLCSLSLPTLPCILFQITDPCQVCSLGFLNIDWLIDWLMEDVRKGPFWVFLLPLPLLLVTSLSVAIIRLCLGTSHPGAVFTHAFQSLSSFTHLKAV